MKQCKKCWETKPVTEFHKNRRTPDGLYVYCKACKCAEENARYKLDPDKIKSRVKEYRDRDIEKSRAKDNARWHKRKTERSEYIGHYHSQRRGHMPTWADASKIREFYASAEALRMHTGEWFVVDHIVPLKGKTVCGLHNEFNLQILTETANNSKQNRWWPDMP